ncbi:ArsR/SmtB family transcription factor [Streptomyces sp. NPDC058855]|uniref:ArsR/SmtB family transcription factor n=1 Tax=Streptomyces sp. NPDC058855 TaxID=3346651 RepID=UPI0036B007BB
MRLHFTTDDYARVRFAPRPSPVPELHAALMMLGAPHERALFGRWRGRLLRALPGVAAPLAELAPAGRAPVFLDVLGETRRDGFERIRSAPPELVRAELARVYAGQGAPPRWVRGLYEGEAEAWRTVDRAQRAAYEAVLAPVWPLVQDLHRAEFARHALAVAERGLGEALTALVPGSRLRDGVWEAAGAGARGAGGRDVRLGGRGLVLLPTFHWRGGPLVQDLPGRSVVLAYPAGPGLPLVPPEAAASGEGLAGVLGRTRAEVLRALAEPRTTTELARRTGVSDATASAHASALRAAGLITTVRTGRSVHHARTGLGSLLAGPAEDRPPGAGRGRD